MPKHLSSELVTELREAFDKYDVDQDGQIQARELRHIMRAVGHEPTEAEVYEQIDVADLDGDRSINFIEFLLMMAPRLRDIESDENLRNAFQVFDRKGIGYFDAVDLRIVMSGMGEEISEEDSQILIAEMDTRGENRAYLNDFLSYMHSGGPGEVPVWRP